MGDNKVVWAVLGVVALIAVVVIVVALTRGGGGEEGYTDEVEADFVDACEASGVSAADCRCVWDGVVDTIAYDDFVAIADELDAADSAGREADLSEYPEFETIATDCTTTGG